MRTRVLVGITLLGLAGCGEPLLTPPRFVAAGTERVTEYPGTDEDSQPDLLTSGLGAAGLASATAPGYVDATQPTALELRTNAIYNNYRALVDISAGGGYGRLYGPNVSPAGEITPKPGKIPGTEYLTYADDGSHRQNVTMMVQVPKSFDPAKPCLVVAASSGSRGVYGAIGTAGEWGLKRGCAVAYTDKGTGSGFVDIATNRGTGIDGVPLDLETRASEATYVPELTSTARADFQAAYPNRIATKHAHSGQNIEASWGKHVLQAAEYGLYVLNRHLQAERDDSHVVERITSANTIIIASSVSNGAGASLRALEQDVSHLIDAVVAAEPNIQPTFDASIRIRQGTGAEVTKHSKSLLDYITLVNLYQPCASRQAALATAPLNSISQAAGEARCQSLLELGLLPGLGSSSTVEEQAAAAQAVINGYGVLEEQNLIQPSHYLLLLPQSIAVTYANQYGAFGVMDNACGYSFASTDTSGRPVATPANRFATLFASSNGTPATAGINLIYNLDPTGPIVESAANLVTSNITGRKDLNIDGALCLRALATGVNPLTNKPVAEQETVIGRYTVTEEMVFNVKNGIAQVRATGNLRGRPAIIVTGRSDGFLPLNHASRPYYALNQTVEKSASQLRYYEVTNAEHLDSLLGTRAFAEHYVPLVYYYQRAMDLMMEHLRSQQPLPPSQVVHTTPRAVNTSGALEDLVVEGHLPAISATPAGADAISFDQGLLSIPQ